MTSVPVFDQDIPGFVPYRDNGDGTFTPLVLPRGGLADVPTIVNLFGNLATNGGVGVIAGPFGIPSDGKSYWLTSSWIQLGPGAGATDLVSVQIEDVNTGTVLSLIEQIVRQSTTLYTGESWSGMVPLGLGQRIISRWSVSAVGISVAASMVLVAY